MWHFSLSTGLLLDEAGTRSIVAYSGAAGIWKNNPALVSTHNKGAIPPGDYVMGTAFTDPIKGTFVIPLTPKPGTNTFGRSGFEIHADSISNPGHASEGCIISCGPYARSDREFIANSPDKELRVSA